MYAVENLLIFDKFTIICDPDLYLKEYQEEQAATNLPQAVPENV